MYIYYKYIYIYINLTEELFQHFSMKDIKWCIFLNLQTAFKTRMVLLKTYVCSRGHFLWSVFFPSALSHRMSRCFWLFFISQRKRMLVFTLPGWLLPYDWEDLANGWEMEEWKGKIQETKKTHHQERVFSVQKISQCTRLLSLFQAIGCRKKLIFYAELMFLRFK